MLIANRTVSLQLLFCLFKHCCATTGSWKNILEVLESHGKVWEFFCKQWSGNHTMALNLGHSFSIHSLTGCCEHHHACHTLSRVL